MIAADEGIRNCVAGFKKIVGYAEEKKINVAIEMLNTRATDHPMKGHPGYQGTTSITAWRSSSKSGLPGSDCCSIYTTSRSWTVTWFAAFISAGKRSTTSIRLVIPVRRTGRQAGNQLSTRDAGSRGDRLQGLS